MCLSEFIAYAQYIKKQYGDLVLVQSDKTPVTSLGVNMPSGFNVNSSSITMTGFNDIPVAVINGTLPVDTMRSSAWGGSNA